MACWGNSLKCPGWGPRSMWYFTFSGHIFLYTPVIPSTMSEALPWSSPRPVTYGQSYTLCVMQSGLNYDTRVISTAGELPTPQSYGSEPWKWVITASRTDTAGSGQHPLSLPHLLRGLQGRWLPCHTAFASVLPLTRWGETDRSWWTFHPCAHALTFFLHTWGNYSGQNRGDLCSRHTLPDRNYNT